MTFEPIIGLEVHVEPDTKQKMFCGCANEPFGSEPNTKVCPTCLGLPGALPVPNGEGVKSCLTIGLALNCRINLESYFERKNYFYPDLPKGYQISQYQKPFCVGGNLRVGEKVIRINRVHLEEDTGKLTHVGSGSTAYSLVNFNRSGVPLVEIVTEPDFNSVDSVIAYVQELQRIIRYLAVSGADMEKGSMRLEPTVNLKITEEGKEYFTPLVEIKNINSFRFVRKALEYEIARQLKDFLSSREEKAAGNKTTVGFNESTQKTYLQREKEEANDYRYYPEPDIPPFQLPESLITEIKDKLPELPEAKRTRLIRDFSLTEYQANIICDTTERALYFDSLVSIGFTGPKAANLLINKPEIITRDPREVFSENKQAAAEVVTDIAMLRSVVEEVVSENPKAASQWRTGKKEVLGFLIGSAMKKTKGRGDPKILTSLFEKII